MDCLQATSSCKRHFVFDVSFVRSVPSQSTIALSCNTMLSRTTKSKPGSLVVLLGNSTLATTLKLRRRIGPAFQKFTPRRLRIYISAHTPCLWVSARLIRRGVNWQHFNTSVNGSHLATSHGLNPRPRQAKPVIIAYGVSLLLSC